MTNKEHVEYMNRYGWITLKQVAKLTGRTSGGGLVRELKRAGLRSEAGINGKRWWLKSAVTAKIKPRHPAGSVRPESAAFIDQSVKRPPELPLGWVDGKKEEKKTENATDMIMSESELLSGIEVDSYKIRMHTTLTNTIIKKAGNITTGSFGISTKHLIQLAREIVRRIDGQTEKPFGEIPPWPKPPPAPLDAEAVRSIVREEIAAAVKKIREALA
jgi:hypothetical protein